MILGITGAIGSGKTTLSQLLSTLQPQYALYETGQIIAELANHFNRALKSEMSYELNRNDAQLVNEALVWFTEALNEQLDKNITMNQLALTPHRLAVHPDQFEKLFTYINQVKRKPTLLDKTINPDNKADYRPLLQWLGGYLVATVSKTIWLDEVFRRIKQHDKNKTLLIINGLRYPQDADVVRLHGGIIIEITRPGNKADTTDITERSRDKIKPDITTINNGSLTQLETIAAQMWHDLQHASPQTIYRAAQ